MLQLGETPRHWPRGSSIHGRTPTTKIRHRVKSSSKLVSVRPMPVSSSLAFPLLEPLPLPSPRTVFYRDSFEISPAGNLFPPNLSLDERSSELSISKTRAAKYLFSQADRANHPPRRSARDSSRILRQRCSHGWENDSRRARLETNFWFFETTRIRLHRELFHAEERGSLPSFSLDRARSIESGLW